jgi:hypothetical protein
MSAYEFAEYQAFYHIEPYPETRADLRNAQLCAILANQNRDAKKRPKPFTSDDFLIDWWGRYKTNQQQSVDVMKANAMAWTVALGGKVCNKAKEK